MSDKKPATTREALVAELIGDVQGLLDRVDLMRTGLAQAENSAMAAAAAVEAATSDYKTTINEMVARLRVETASIINQTTEHAARSLVGQQTSTLRQAATEAIQQALTADVLRRRKKEWLYGAILSGVSGFAGAALFQAVRSL